VASGVKDPETYSRGLEYLNGLGIDVSKAPPNYDPAWVSQKMNEALSMGQQLDEAHRQFTHQHQTRTLDETIRHNKATEGIMATKAAKGGGGEGGIKPSDIRGLRHDVEKAIVEYHGGMYVAQPDGTFRITGLDKKQAARVRGLAERGSSKITDKLRAGEDFMNIDPQGITAETLREAGLPVEQIGNAPRGTNEPTATNPKTGEKMVFRNGQWQPLR
jgi:hypothetical protein